MKAILLLASIIFASYFSFAQTNSAEEEADVIHITIGRIMVEPSGVTPSISKGTILPKKNLPNNNPGARGCTKDSLFIDYSTANADNRTYTIRMNRNYKPTDIFTLQYIVAAFDSLYDTPNSKSYSYNDGVVIVDSIFYDLGHQNVSGIDDTLITSIIMLDANGYPTNTVLWADTLITDTSLSPISWALPLEFKFAPDLALPANTMFGVRLDYFGDVSDLLGVRAGWKDGCGTCYASKESDFYPNSYYYLNYGSLLTGFWPTSNGIDLIYDCDSNQIATKDSCERMYFQNWKIRARVSIQSLGVNVGNDETLCSDDNITMSPNVQGLNKPFTYSWSPPIGLSDPNIEKPIASPNTTTTYTLTVADTKNCQVSDDIELTINPSPKITFPLDTQVCASCTVLLNAGNPGAAYIWSTGQTTQKINATPGGAEYWVNVTKGNCVGFKSIAIWVTGVDEPNVDGVDLKLYPNPHFRIINVNYFTSKKAKNTIELFDIAGKKIQTIFSGEETRGEHTHSILVKDLNLLPGVYILTLNHDGGNVSTRMVVTESR
ncbi:MAG: T9SS type A sorting domain-containing protein [Bacteroidetes bacterium]|nr:T9SS type A sorting domain-containing protein [Bacteroidota bacterium]